MEMEWCADNGVPHSQFLAWQPSDRAKLIATLLERNSRCQSCGTADHEWEEDSGAYVPMVNVCQGCRVLYAAEEENETSLGARMVLVPKRRAAEIAASPKRIRRRR